MARRIRTVKPEWLEDEVLAAASDEARVLSIGLILLADDYGNGRCSIATIAAEVWRFELERDNGARAPETIAKASRAFRELVANKFVGVWTVAGQSYYAIRNWTKHQRVDKPGKTAVPKPPAGLFDENPGAGGDSRSSREAVANDSRSPRDILAPDLDLDQDLEGKGAARAPEATAAAPKEPPPRRDPFAASLVPPTDVERHAFAAWAKAWGKTGVSYDPRRAECLSERVRLGMTAQDADDAIAGALADDWVNGTKDGEKKTKLTVIFGSAESFEDYRDKGRALRQRPSGTLRKAATVAELIAAQEAALAADRAARGVRIPVGEPSVPSAEEFEQLMGNVGGSVG